MVSTVNDTSVRSTTLKRPSHLVELVGLAGTGKSTLLLALNQRNERIVAGIRLSRMGSLPFFVTNTLFLLPTYIQHYRSSRWFTRAEIRSMAYLEAWHHAIGRRVSNNGPVIVMDHGPIFRLVQLREFGPEITASQRYQRWWDGMLNQWAATLDMIIWLDAQDSILLKRIHARDHQHQVKQKSEQEAYEFLAHYRTSYEQIVAKLTADGGPRVLRFDTDEVPLGQIVARVLAALDLEHVEG